MCNKCDELEALIQRYRKLVTGLDPLTIERVEALILELRKTKEAIQH